MPTPPTFAELLDAGKTEIEARNPDLTDWTPGSRLDAVNGGGALLADEVIRLALAGFAALFIDTAEGEDLDALVLDRAGMVRLDATAAVGLVRFTRGVSVGTLPIPEGTAVRGTVDGVIVTVEVDTDTDMPAGDSYVDVVCTCTVVGRSGNVAAGVLDELVDAIPGDAGVTVTNPARFAGGDTAETDPELRDRFRRWFVNLRRGTVGALETGALSVPGVQFATVDESFVDPDDGGYVAIYVGDPEGAGNDVLADAVEDEIENWRAAGVAVQIFASAREEIDLVMTIRHRPNIDRTALAAAIRASVLAVVDNLGPGKTLYLSTLVAAAHRASPDVISASVTTPSSNAAPSATYNAIRVLTADFGLSLTEG